MRTLGLDVGGANLKAADGSGQAWTMPFALWREPAALDQRLADLVARAGPCDGLALTMTAELCDCFASKRHGVEHVLNTASATAGDRPLHIWTLDGRFVTEAEARARPLRCAASNWLALATWAARNWALGTQTLLLDVGSTTTDVIWLADGQPRPSGWTDTERLTSGELVYLGVKRTPLMALGPHVLFNGRPVRLMAEHFATSEDVFVLAGKLPAEPGATDTADGRPMTCNAAAARIARMIGADLEQLTMTGARDLAGGFAHTMARRIVRAIGQVTGGRRPDRVVVSGAGEFLASEAATGVWPDVDQVSLTRQVGRQISAAACAHALVQVHHAWYGRCPAPPTGRP